MIRWDIFDSAGGFLICVSARKIADGRSQRALKINGKRPLGEAAPAGLRDAGECQFLHGIEYSRPQKA